MSETAGHGYHLGNERSVLLAKRMRYLQKHGAKWLWDGLPPPAPGYPRWEEPVKATKVKTRASKREENKAEVARVVSEGGAASHAAEILGVSERYCQKLWQEIVQDMGWQAQ